MTGPAGVYLVVTASDDEIRHGEVFDLLSSATGYGVVVVQRGNDAANRSRLQAHKDVLTVVSVPPCGGSAARNAGIRWLAQHVSARSWVGFPDDDCVIANGTLQFVESLLGNEEWSFLLGRYGPTLDGIDRSVYPSSPVRITGLPMRDHRLVSAATLFCRLGSLVAVDGYVQEIGVGAHWDAGEENDLVNRIMGTGGRGVYYPEIQVLHPYRDHGISRGVATWIGLNSAYARVSPRFAPVAAKAWLGLLGRAVRRRMSIREVMCVAREALNAQAQQAVARRFVQASAARQP